MTLALDFTSNRDVSDSMIEEAFAPARNLTDPPPGDRVFSLVWRMVEVAVPGDGAGRLLQVLARLAKAGWVEGALDVLLQKHEDGTVLDVLVFDGLSYQRSFQTLLLPVPLSEFVEFFAMNQSNLAPLTLVRDVPGEELNLAALDGPPPSQSGRPVFQPDLSHKPTLRLERVTVPEEAIPSHVENPPPTTRPTEPHYARTVRIPAVRSTTQESTGTDVDEDWD
ncbi:MAG TPA: hypothetical protein PKA88_25055 [Polyangiaceae bacterium]|nr:hypothetical protein [Polyangiaceae bacterium]